MHGPRRAMSARPRTRTHAAVGTVAGLSPGAFLAGRADVYSTFGSVDPASAKNMEETTMALRSFIGDSRVKRFYSDNADEPIGAARTLGAP